MNAEWDGQHPTEGTIHAWLDGQLGDDDAGRIAAHITACAACAARVAEARGLIAGAARVVSLLDPAGTPSLQAADTAQLRAQSIANRVAGGGAWRWLRVTPARAAIAATLIIAVGVTLTREHAADDAALRSPGTAPSAASRQPNPPVAAPEVASAPAGQGVPANRPAPPPPSGGATPAAGGAAPAAPPAVAAPVRDSLLDAAVARRLASEQPVRTVEPAAPTIPSTPVSSGNLARMDTASAKQVLAERAASRVAIAASGASAVDRVAAKAAGPVMTAAGCYRIDPVEVVPVSWNGVPLPVDLALLATPAVPAAGGALRYAIASLASASQLGAWSTAGGDTLSITLLGATVATSGVLFPSGSAFGGSLRAEARGSQALALARPATAEQVIRVAAHRIPCAR